MRETYPEKKPGDPLEAEHVNKLSRTARELAGRSGEAGIYGQGYKTALPIPFMQRVVVIKEAAEDSSSSSSPSGSSSSSSFSASSLSSSSQSGSDTSQSVSSSSQSFSGGAPICTAFTFAGAGNATTDQHVGQGTEQWQDVGNIVSDDNIVANVFLRDAGLVTYALRSSNHGFSIPALATITSIVVRVEKHQTPVTGSLIEDLAVRLYSSGAYLGTNKAIAGSWPTTTGQVFIYGGVSDTWGRSWTPAEINSGDFGLGIWCKQNGSGVNARANVDYVSIRVCYTTP